jgi:sugar phosphate permease
MALFATEWLRRDTVTAGGVLSMALTGGMVGRIVWGIVSDRVFGGRRKPALTVAGALAAAALGSLALLGPPTPLPIVLPLVFAVGFAVLGWQGVAMAMTAELAEPADVGRVVGFALTALQVGPIVGPPLIGRLLDVTGSYPLAWSVLAASCALATLIFAAAMSEGARPGRTETRA